MTGECQAGPCLEGLKMSESCLEGLSLTWNPNQCILNLESDSSSIACFSCILTSTREKTKESDSSVNVAFSKTNNSRSFRTIFICLSNHKKQTFMFYLS